MASYTFGYSYGFGSSGGVLTNICWDTLTATDTVYSSTVSPTETSDGTLIYNIQFDTSDGEFIMQFGVAGDEDLENTAVIIFEYNGTKLDLQWDSVNEYYTGTDSTLATEIALEVDNNNVCFLATVIPDLFISYDYETIEEDS